MNSLGGAGGCRRICAHQMYGKIMSSQRFPDILYESVMRRLHENIHPSPFRAERKAIHGRDDHSWTLLLDSRECQTVVEGCEGLTCAHIKDGLRLAGDFFLATQLYTESQVHRVDGDIRAASVLHRSTSSAWVRHRRPYNC